MEKLTQKIKIQSLSTYPHADESRVKFRCPRDIYLASRQNSTAAFS